MLSIISQLEQTRLDAKCVMVAADEDRVYIVNCAPASAPSDVNWNVHMEEAMNFISETYAQGHYGAVTSLSIYPKAIEGVTEMTLVMSVAKAEEEGLVKSMPRSVLVPLRDGSVVRLRTLVSEHGLYRFYAMNQGADVKTDSDTCTKVGPITHIMHNNVIRAVSAAHVLTHFINDNIVNIDNIDRWWKKNYITYLHVLNFELDKTLDFSEGYRVSGHTPAEVYPTARVVFSPRRNLYDFAWVAEFNPHVPPRNAVINEQVRMFNRATGLIQGVVVTVSSQRGFKLDDSAVYMTGGFQVDFGQDGLLIYEGTSGSLVFAVTDCALLGLLTGEGDETFKYMTRIP